MSLSIAALQHKYNLNQNLIDNWHKALRSLSASDFYTSEIDFDYPDAINYVLGPMEDQILVKIGLNSIPTVYQPMFDYLTSKNELPYALVVQNHYLYWLYVQEEQVVTDNRGIPHKLGNGIPVYNREFNSVISANTAVVDLDDLNNWRNMIHVNYDYRVDETGLWRVSLPDDITGDNNNF